MAKHPEAQIADVVRSHMARVTNRIMEEMGSFSTTATAAPEPEPLTAEKLLSIARDLPPPLPRLVPVPRGWDTACIGGDEVVHVWEENPAYGLIPSQGFLAFLSALAEDERERIVKRAADGRKLARKKGVRLGRKPKLTEHQITRARHDLARGESCRAVGRDLNVHHSTISRLR